MPRDITWGVDGGGVATQTVPGNPVAITTQVRKAQMEAEANRLNGRLTGTTKRRDRLIAEVDALTTEKDAIEALLLTVTAEPPVGP
jgi:hypothetical protein